jgi:hypothetical protein
MTKGEIKMFTEIPQVVLKTQSGGDGGDMIESYL